MNSLPVQTARTFIIGIVALGILLFLPAWTLAYWQAWVFIVVFMISINVLGLYLTLKDPVLLERRKKVGREQSTTQTIIMLLAGGTSLGLLVFCAFDYRFAWSPTSWYISVVGDILVAFGLFINLLVFKENSYGGSTIEIVEGQKVISTGLYARVRHPMYVGVLVMLAGIPLALGSWWGLAVFALVIPVLMWRILDEEKLLKKDLPGYSAYTQKVHYRLVPYLW